MAIMENEKAIWLTGDGRVNEIVDRLRDYRDSDLLWLYREANAYDGNFEFVNTFDVADLTCIFDNINDLIHAIIHGNVTNITDQVRFDGSGDLETVTEETLYDECGDYIKLLAEWLMDNHSQVDGLYTEDEELFNKWQEIDNEKWHEVKEEDVVEDLLMDMVYNYKGSSCHCVMLKKSAESGAITVITSYGEVVARCASGNKAAEVLKNLSDGKYA